MDYAKESKQEVVMIQWDVEKSYDRVSLSFVAQLMSHMGFGSKKSHPTFMLGYTLWCQIMKCVG